MIQDELSHGERLKIAIDLKKPDRVPSYCTSGWCVNMAGNNLKCIGQPEKDVSYPKYIRNPDIYAEAQIKSLEFFDHDCVQVLTGSNSLAVPLGCEEVEPYWGIPGVTKHAISKASEWQDLSLPDMDTTYKLPVHFSAVRLLDRELHDRRGEDVFIVGGVLAPFTLAGIVMGIENLMFAMLDEPDDTKDLINFCADAIIEFNNKQFDEGADQVLMPDPSASGDLIAEEQFREFALPYAKRVTDEAKKYKDKYAMHYHICGNTMDRLEDLAEVGASVLSLDSLVDLKEAKSRIGDRTCLCGNINPADTVFLGTPDQIEEEGKQCIRDAANGGGYIYWAGCDFPIDTPLENMIRLFEVPKKYGQYID